MVENTFFAIGTPGGQWPAWLYALFGIETAGLGEGSAGGCIQAPGLADAESRGATKVLVVVERPALGLAAALADGLVDDPASWLRKWCERARHLSWYAQSDPERHLFVDAEDAWQYPGVLADSINARFGLGVVPKAEGVQPAAADPLYLALAEAMVSADPDAQALFAELQASCVLLAAERPLTGDNPGLPRLDGRAATRQLHQIRLDARLAHEMSERLAHELTATRADLQTREAAAQDRLAQQHQAYQSQAQALAEARENLSLAMQELVQARQESQLLLAQLQQVQVELESTFLGRQEAQGRLAEALADRDAERQVQGGRLAEMQQQLNQQRQAAKDLHVQLEQAQAHAGSLQDELRRHLEEGENALRAAQTVAAAREAELAAAQEQAAAARASELKLADLQRDAADHRQENELLLLQLHQVQEELEHYHLECRRLQQAAASTAQHLSPQQPTVTVAGLHLVGERDTPPHRELSFHLRQVMRDGQAVPEAIVRLVEHHGHPGLVVFGNAPGPQLLSGWTETGQEDGRPYMLLVPDDASAQPMLDALGPEDRELLHALPTWLEQALESPDGRRGRHWQQVARRLREQLLSKGRRFSYQQVEQRPAQEGTPSQMALCFKEVRWGTYQLPEMVVHWQPEGPHAGIVLLNDVDIGPPLMTWPDDDQGLPLDRWHLPLGSGPSRQDKHQAWSKVSALDRSFLLALLAAWPLAMARSAEGAPARGPAAMPLAEALLPDALQVLRRSGRWLRPRRAPKGPGRA